MAIVRPRISWGTVRRKMVTPSRPRMRLTIISPSRAKLDVLIPPPVDPGEAPMNIRIIISRMVGLAKAAMSTVLNPQVRGVTDWNNEASTRPGPRTPTRTLPASKR